jgi:chromosome segregation ATPase
MSFEEERDRVNRLWDKSIEGYNKKIKELESQVKQLTEKLSEEEDKCLRALTHLQREIDQLKEQLEKVQSAWIVATANLGGAETELDFKQGVIDGQNILITEHQKRYDEMKDRLAKAQDVLKDICHHVEKNCFATCKGDWSGTSCLTYRIFDAMNGESTPKGDASDSTQKNEVIK